MTKHRVRFNVSAIDLHCHTTASDGKHSPEQLLELAKTRGIKMLAITDHDTVDGFRSVRKFADKAEVQLISGIELSCVWSGISIHIVGLNFDASHPAMLAAEEHQEKVREQRAEIIVERLGKQLRHSFDLEAIRAIANGGQIGRPHIAQYMVENDLVANIGLAFTKYLGAGKPGDVKSGWPSMEQTVKWIIDAGGVAVMAHAHRYKMTRTKLRRCMQEFVDAGGRAIEVAYSTMDASQQQHMVDLAKQFDLLGSCGSDYHGPNRFGLELGYMPKFPKDIRPVWSEF